MKEIENVMAVFIAEMKEENELFIQKLNEVEKEKKGKTMSKENKDSPIPAASFDKELTVNKSLHTKKQAVNAYQKTAGKESREKEDVNELLHLISSTEKEKTLLEQVVDLSEQGKKTEEIAKILNKGKTEIELFLKFRQKSHE
ncbi:MAG: hypothetical protein ABF649_11230 [Bacillus sp. (in: firmicutes)]